MHPIQKTCIYSNKSPLPIRKPMKRLLLYVLLLSTINACRKENYPSDVPLSRSAYTFSGKQVQNYFNLLCKISKSTPGFFPPQVARAYGYVGITAYETVVNGIPGAQSLGSQLNGFNVTSLPTIQPEVEYDWAISSNAGLAFIIKKMFDQNISAYNSSAIDSLENIYLGNSSISADPVIRERSINYGRAVAQAIYQYSINDGGDKSYLDPFQLPYIVPADPFCWIPTGAVLHPISPFWGKLRPFIQANVANTQNYAPVPFSTNPTSAFYQQAQQVYDQVKHNTTDQVEIAQYWADDPFNTCTPTGHTFNILTQLLNENNATLEKTSVAYAKMSIAENDAFIACWQQKYKHVLIRPYSYIRQYIDAGFNTVIGTPPFPAFTSGHSAEIGAGAQVLTDLFTDGSGNYDFTDYSQLQYGFSPRHFTNFNTMAKECADSRFFGGIHYPMDNEFGLEQGISIGRYVNTLINWPTNIR